MSRRRVKYSRSAGTSARASAKSGASGACGSARATISAGSAYDACEPVDELRADDDRGRDLPRIRATETEGVEPWTDLLRRHFSRQRGQTGAPGGNAKVQLRIELGETGGQAHCFLVCCQARMDDPVRADLGEPADRERHIAFLKERDQLFAQPRTRQPEEALRGRGASELEGALVHPEAVAVLVPDRPEDARRVVFERALVEHTDRPGHQIALTVEGVDESTEVGRIQGCGDRVDREVAAGEIRVEAGEFDDRQRGRSGIRLAAGGDNVDLPAVAVADDCRSERTMGDDRALEGRGQTSSELDPVALDGDVDVEALLAEQDVAHRSADEVDAALGSGHIGDRPADRREPIQRPEPVGDRV